MVVFRGEGAFEPTPEMLCMGSRTNPLTWEVMSFYPIRQCFPRLCHRTLYIRPFDILLMERHTEIEHVLRPSLFWDCMQLFLFDVYG